MDVGKIPSGRLATLEIIKEVMDEIRMADKNRSS